MHRFILLIIVLLIDNSYLSVNYSFLFQFSTCNILLLIFTKSWWFLFYDQEKYNVLKTFTFLHNTNMFCALLRNFDFVNLYANSCELYTNINFVYSDYTLISRLFYLYSFRFIIRKCIQSNSVIPNGFPE